jgi:hypothetical protein
MVVKFKGRCKDLELHVYDYITTSQAARDYESTTSKIAKYMGRTYKRGVDVQRIISNGVIDPIKEPDELDLKDLLNTVKKVVWEKLIMLHVQPLEKREENVQKAYMLVYGQCSEGVWSKLKSMPGFNGMEKTCDLVLLLSSLKTVMFSYQGQQNKTHELIDAQMWQAARHTSSNSR